MLPRASGLHTEHGDNLAYEEENYYRKEKKRPWRITHLGEVPR